MMTIINLNGTWDFVADLDPKYHAIHGGFHLPETNRRHWLPVPVPGVWQTYGERYSIFEGVCWFARKFDVPYLPDSACARLRFGAVNYRAQVTLNGEDVGNHEGGTSEFVLDVTRALRQGPNHLAVQVDNRATTIKWPPCLGTFNYGGMHRSVSLEVIDGPALDAVTLETTPMEDGRDWELHVGGQVLNSCPGLIVRVRAESGFSWEDTVAAGGALASCVPFFDTPAWTPETPHLERVHVELMDETRRVVDGRTYDVGFRSIVLEQGKIRLNGQAYPLKGVCYVYDSDVSGLVMTAEQIETDLQLMKEAGCNAVRCHYPMDRVFYRACDRLGLLVWIEPPIYCYHPDDQAISTHFTDADSLALALQMAREMVAVARNHPSVAMYGIGNECNTTHPEAETFFRAVAGAVREADSTRLIAYAAFYGRVGPLADIVDVLGINSYWGWYDKVLGGEGLDPEFRVTESTGVDASHPAKEPIDLRSMRDMLDQVFAQKQDLALLLTEFGADSVPGHYSFSRDLWSEDYHADLLREIFSLALDYPRIVGTFPFCFSDYRDPSKVHNGYWNELNLKGLVDYRRHRKMAFHAVRDIYAGTATPG